jgi:hypothetical protein
MGSGFSQGHLYQCLLFAPIAHSSPENLLTRHAYYQVFRKKTETTKKKLSVFERDGLLWEASRANMRGKISSEELSKIERSWELPDPDIMKTIKEAQDL